MYIPWFICHCCDRMTCCTNFISAAVTSILQVGWGQHILIWQMHACNTCRQGLNYSVKSSTRMCIRSHLELCVAPQSPFQHTGYPTLMPAEELMDTSTVLQPHSTTTTLLVRQHWTDYMLQVCLWHMHHMPSLILVNLHLHLSKYFCESENTETAKLQ